MAATDMVRPAGHYAEGCPSRGGHVGIRSAVVAAAMLGWISPSHAQDAVPAEGILPPVAPQEQKPEIVLSEVRIVGNTVLPQAVLQATVKPFLYHPLATEDLEELRQRLTRDYVQRGYVNSGAVIPDQKITHGVLTMRIVEGRASGIDVTGTKMLNPDYVRDRLALGAGSPLNINDVERQVQLLLQDPAIDRLNVNLRPGIAPGDAVLDARVSEARPVSLTGSIANDEPPEVGSIHGELAGTIRSLTGWGDVLALRYGRTESINTAGVSWGVPVTPYDTLFSLKWDYDNSRIVTPPFSTLNITSETQTYEIGLSQPIYRTPTQRLTLGTLLDWRRETTSLLGEGFSFTPGVSNGVAKVTVLRLFQDWVDHEADQALALRSTFSIGLHALGSTVTGTKPDSRFFTWLGQAQYARRVVGDNQLLFRADLQLSHDPLFPMEQIAVGGINSVRGYREEELVRDNALILSVEDRIPLAHVPAPGVNGSVDGVLQLAPFVDYGNAWNTGIPTPSPRVISSVGLGLRWDAPPNLLAELYWGYGLNKVPVSGHDLQDYGVHFRLVMRFF